MKLNHYVHALLAIFNSESDPSSKLQYRYYKDVDTSMHLLLEQDQTADYYMHKVEELLMVAPHPILAYECSHWQIREMYRLVNTAIASYSSSLDPFRETLTVFKSELEKDTYLADFLQQMSKRENVELVCSGHGTSYSWHKPIDLSQYGSQTEVVVYSGLGGLLSQSLGVDIENQQFNPDKVIVRNLREKKEEEGYSPMFFYSATGSYRTVPDFTLVDCHKLPHPRVIEPETGTVVFDMSQVSKKKNYFSLSTVIQRFPNRKIHWAACTGVTLPDGKNTGPCVDLAWKKKEDETLQRPTKKRKLESKDEQSYTIPNF
ncbi:putative adhesin [Legionella maceachernii]|uniref:Uncharacterized protein n=1 Tax=Legionella maceachernii TaxID=466 RepID=A0A0W0WG63_9GAMM|nr:hypothetical protein [Legionella maceachernii]KTD31303.1 hypothetical protein Lmac_0357 [Legionella maceachernii]SKA00131.1 hypothetical protein SAMN02745128_01731 [Legionella maceachernii]SUP01310.1 Uncharacterised protein [Legionella maceachernii]